MWTSCVYKITVGEQTYVGSTCNFKDRLKNHKHCCYNTESKGYNYKIYKYIREHSHWDNIKVEVLVHLHPKFNKAERTNVEQEWIDYIKPTLNDHKAYTVITKKEYNKQNYIDNKDRINEKHKQFYKDNKDKFSEKFNCDCGGKYTHNHKFRHLKSKKHLKYMDTE
tara:strand:+ start:137 stop:634 length:498 start_codon:yes stop_codon:yes gene_type:complete